MITFVRGILIESLPTHAVVDVNGIGYLIHIPLSSFDRLPAPGQTVRLLTHLVVREDSHALYGFSTPDERDLFRLLTAHVSGIGPKLALAVLSGMPVSRFKASVVDGDVAALSTISGLGKKTAQRVILELKDKVGVAAAWEASSNKHEASADERGFQDTVLALISLGYRQTDAQKAARSATDSLRKEGLEVRAEETLRRALRILA